MTINNINQMEVMEVKYTSLEREINKLKILKSKILKELSQEVDYLRLIADVIEVIDGIVTTSDYQALERAIKNKESNGKR